MGKSLSREKKWENECNRKQPKNETIDILDIEELSKTVPMPELLLRLSPFDRMAVIEDYKWGYGPDLRIPKDLCGYAAVTVFEQDPSDFVSALNVRIEKEKMIKNIPEMKVANPKNEDGYRPEDIKRLMERATSTLKNLDLYENDYTGDKGAAEIAKFLEKEDECALETLELEDCGIGDEGLVALAEALKKNKSLRTLVLTNNRFKDPGVLALSQALAENSTLLHLTLKHNDCNLVLLAEGLKGHSRLKELDLEGVDIDEHGIVALGKALNENHYLEYINLSTSFMGDSEGIMSSFASSVIHNTTLRTLKLEYNEIGHKGAEALALLITKIPSLQKLYISHNDFGDEGAEIVARFLASKKSKIQSLDLSNNNIKKRGLCALFESLAKNSSLHFLKLSSDFDELDVNNSDEWAFCLAKALVANKNLQSLLLSNTNIGESGGRAIADALTKNKTMLSLIFWSNLISKETMSSIKQSTRKNKEMNDDEKNANKKENRTTKKVKRRL